jgi:predicted ATPase
VQGFADQALAEARISLEVAQARDYRFSICEALRLAVCPLALMTGDVDGAERAVTMLTDLAKANDAPFWKMVARCLQGRLLICRGEYATGSSILRSALDTCEISGWIMQHPEFLGALGEGLAGLGQLAEAIAVIDKAIAAAGRGGEIWCLAELIRLKGEFLLLEAQGKSASSAEDCFLEALDMARQQHALAWGLRSSMSLARLRLRQNRRADARQVLAEVYARFTEGFATQDLVSAETLLRTLRD